jgi:hypothetical protein
MGQRHGADHYQEPGRGLGGVGPGSHANAAGKEAFRAPNIDQSRSANHSAAANNNAVSK